MGTASNWKMAMKFNNCLLERVHPSETWRRKPVMKKRKIEPSVEGLEMMHNDRKSFKNKPGIWIILPVWNTNEKWLKQAIDFVIIKLYDNLGLCIVDDASNKEQGMLLA